MSTINSSDTIQYIKTFDILWLPVYNNFLFLNILYNTVSGADKHTL